MDKYEQYILEREDALLYEDKVGFFTYRITDDIFQVNDLFILPEFRKLGFGKNYAKLIEEMANFSGCKLIICFSCKDANNWKQSDKYILLNDYKKIKETNTMIYYQKEL